MEWLDLMGIAIEVSKMLGGASPEPDDRRNQNPDFLAGYAVGMTCDKKSELDPIADEWRDRGEPNGTDRLFKEWKRGYWAGVFHRIEGRSWSNAPADLPRTGEAEQPKALPIKAQRE